MKTPETIEDLQNNLSERLEHLTFRQGETENNWAELRQQVSEAALETLGTMKRHHQDWFDENDDEIEALLKDKYVAHKIWLTDKTCSSKHNNFKQARSKLQRRLREMKDD